MVNNVPHPMVEDGNRTSHTYDEEIARTIYQALPGYTDLLGNLLEKLKAGEIRRAHEEA